MAINENDSRVIRTKILIRRAFAVLAREKSIDKISVKELAERAEINRGTFYLHYADTADLLQHLQAELYGGFEELLKDATPERIHREPLAILIEICSFLKKNSDICIVVLGADRSSEFSIQAEKKINDGFLQLFKNAYPSLSEDKYELVCSFFKCGAAGLIKSWLDFYPEKPPREVAELLLTLAKQGVHGFTDTDRKADTRI